MISTSLTNEELHLFYNLSTDILCIIDKDGFIKFCNNNLLSILGYTKNQAQNKPLLNWLYKTDKKAFQQKLLESKKLAKQVKVENRFLNSDGSFIWLEWHLQYVAENDAYYCNAKEVSNIKSYENQLYNLQNNLVSVLENIGDAFFTVDNSWTIKYWNKQAEILLGKNRKDVLEKNFWQVCPLEVRKGFYQQYHRAFVEQKPMHFEEYFHNLNAWYRVSAYPTSEGLAVYFRDISESRKTTKELKEINDRYRLVSKATSEAIWDWDIEKNQIYWHGQNYKKLFGYDVVNTTSTLEIWLDYIHPADKERVVNRLNQAIEDTADNWQDQYWFKKANGEYAYVNDRAYIVRNADGKAVRLIGSIDDITPQRLAEDALGESEKDYKTLFNNAPLPSFIYEKETLKFLNVNDAALKHYGFSIGEFLQMTILQIRPENDVDRTIKAATLIDQNSGPFTMVAPHRKKNGEEFIADITAININYKGKPSVLVTVNDITKRVELEERVSRLKVLRQKKITQATINGQEKERQFIGKELHDNINQVLTTTKLYLEFAQENAEMRMSLIDKSKNNLIKIINDIRALCKSLVPPTIEDIGITDAITELIESIQVTQKFQIFFQTKGDIEELSHDMKITLFRVIQEQLNNIIKYAEARNVWIDLKVNGKINLNIKDDGVGFDTVAKRKGVGLTNMKNRADLYNGILVINSKPGEGCQIRFQIPLTEVLTPGFNILIVEDNEDDQEFLKEAFDEVAPQHNLLFMTDGRKVIERLRNMPDEDLPSLIILDYNLPGLNGVEMLKLLGLDQRAQEIPKIVYTTASHNRYKEQSYSANATAYIEKGFTLEEIKDNVRQMLTFAVK